MPRTRSAGPFYEFLDELSKKPTLSYTLFGAMLALFSHWNLSKEQIQAVCSGDDTLIDRQIAIENVHYTDPQHCPQPLHPWF